MWAIYLAFHSIRGYTSIFIQNQIFYYQVNSHMEYFICRIA